MKENFLASFKEALQIEDREVLITDVFRDYEEWDSLSRLSLIAALDEEYDLQIEDREFEQLVTVGDLMAVVESKVNG
ncbi:MAG: acyl carrier protein [Ferruginibacter sp.]|uniref:acyl carrier protein n=1 Tax=Ferruginibacter sp. TaxID=1940288 RepID=UPI00265AE309|nr:acyl carrier protein [Ferruginibacter sp.]MDB5275528.1 acyl carrier protein [Ferruginibacter sp.]